MILSEEDINKAKESQGEYWNKLIENLDFFNKSEITLEKIIFIRNNIPCYGEYYDHFIKKAENHLKGSNSYFCHFWLSNYLEYAVMSCWNDYYNFNRARGLKEKECSKIADTESNFFKDYLLGLFP